MIVALADNPLVVAVITTLGRDNERLEACLSSVQESHFTGRLAVVVVWNDRRQPVPALESVTLLDPGINLGFPGSLNHARSSINAEYLWILQDDVRVEPTCLAALMARMTHPDQPALVSPVYLNEEGLIPAATRAGVLDGCGNSTMYPFIDTRPEDLNRNDQIDWVSTSGALARLTSWDAVGGYDPDFYPLQASDVDFGYRLRQSGYAIALEPTALVIHEGQGSTPSLLLRFLIQANTARFKSKHFLHDLEDLGPLDVDEVLVRKVARAASLGLIDFARYASTIDAERESEQARLRAELHMLRWRRPWMVQGIWREVRPSLGKARHAFRSMRRTNLSGR